MIVLGYINSQMLDINSTRRRECLGHKQAQLITMHNWLPDRGDAIKGLVVCWSIARINDLWDGYMDKRKVRSLVPCCGQDGNRPQHPIDSRKHFVVLVWWIPAYNFLLTLILLDVIVYVLFAGIKNYTWYRGNGLLDKLWTWHIVQILWCIHGNSQ